MTVSELIRRLSKLDGDTTIKIAGDVNDRDITAVLSPDMTEEDVALIII